MTLACVFKSSLLLLSSQNHNTLFFSGCYSTGTWVVILREHELRWVLVPHKSTQILFALHFLYSHTLSSTSFWRSHVAYIIGRLTMRLFRKVSTHTTSLPPLFLCPKCTLMTWVSSKPTSSFSQLTLLQIKSFWKWNFLMKILMKIAIINSSPYR